MLTNKRNGEKNWKIHEMLTSTQDLYARKRNNMASRKMKDFIHTMNIIRASGK